MPRKERPLPEPPRGKRAGEAAGGDELIFDKLQEAMAEGKLEKFVRENLPAGQYAQRLTEMMMGMSGMPVSGMPPEQRAEEKKGEGKNKIEEVPADVLQAVREGDAGKLQGLLRREQGKRGGQEPGKEKGEAFFAGDTTAEQANAAQFPGSLIEKEVIDSLMEIGVDHGLSMDWLILRALKLYIKKYRETGQL